MALRLRIGATRKDQLEFLHDMYVVDFRIKEVYPNPTVALDLKVGPSSNVIEDYLVEIEFDAVGGFRPVVQTREVKAIVQALERAGVLELMKDVYSLAFRLRANLGRRLYDIDKSLLWLSVKPPVFVVIYSRDGDKQEISFNLDRDENKIVWHCFPRSKREECDARVREMLSWEGVADQLKELLDKAEKLEKLEEEFKHEIKLKKLKTLL